MIRCEWGRQTASNLLLRGVDVQFRSYKNVDHEMDTTEVNNTLFLFTHCKCNSFFLLRCV